MHLLTLLAVGPCDVVLPDQNSAPIRLVYGLALLVLLAFRLSLSRTGVATKSAASDLANR